MWAGLVKGIISGFLGFFSRILEINRAKKQGANEQSLKNQEKANEQLTMFQEIDSDVNDDDAIDFLSKPRDSK